MLEMVKINVANCGAKLRCKLGGNLNIPAEGVLSRKPIQKIWGEQNKLFLAISNEIRNIKSILCAEMINIHILLRF